ncbi:hypothetical protein Ahia01_000316900 [Argonauta hians]
MGNDNCKPSPDSSLQPGLLLVRNVIDVKFPHRENCSRRYESIFWRRYRYIDNFTDGSWLWQSCFTRVSRSTPKNVWQVDYAMMMMDDNGSSGGSSSTTIQDTSSFPV